MGIVALTHQSLNVVDDELEVLRGDTLDALLYNMVPILVLYAPASDEQDISAQTWWLCRFHLPEVVHRKRDAVL
jgi:hypothetical protein